MRTSSTRALALLAIMLAAALTPASSVAITAPTTAFELPRPEAAALDLDPIEIARELECATIGSNAALPCEAWSARYCASTCAQDIAYLVEVTPDSKRIVTSGVARVGTGDEFLTVAYDENGARLWAKGYIGEGLTYNFPTAMALSPDGSRVFVTGFIQTSLCCFGGDYATLAYDMSDGGLLWVARYGGEGASTATAIATSPDGARVFVTGKSNLEGPSGYDFATIAYDAMTGGALWTTRWNGETGSRYALGDYDGANGLAVAPDGSRLYVTGWTYGGSTELDSMTVSYDAITGSQEWTKRLVDGGTSEYTSAVEVSPDGSRVFLAGGTSEHGTADFLIASLDAASGATAWSASYGYAGEGFDDDVLYSFDLAADGSRVVATGPSWNVDRYSYATVAWDASTGAQEWAARYSGPAGGDSRAYGVRLSPDATRAYVTGWSGGINVFADAYDIATLSYDALTGEIDKTWRYDGPPRSRDLGFALAPSPDGARVYSVGTSAGSHGFLYTTLAYDT